jgi:hypothetical protein
MVLAVKQTVTVQPGGVVEVRSPELTPGSRAEVIVLLDQRPEAECTWSGFIGSVKGLFKSVEEIDSYVRELRNEWDR